MVAPAEQMSRSISVSDPSPKHQLAGDFTAPLFDSALESSQLPWRERAGHAFLQTEEQIFGIGVGLFVEPLLNLRPDCFKWVHTSAIGSWPAGSLAMCRTHFPIAPHGGKTGDEAAQLRGRLSRFGVDDTDFKLRQHSLRFSNFAQQSNRVQRRQRLPELFLALRLKHLPGPRDVHTGSLAGDTS